MTEVAYIIKAFPRTSETFIANEVALLEAAGRRLEIFSIKKLEGQRRHAALARIRSRVHYLPQADDLEGGSFGAWLMRNLPRFLAAHLALIARRPRRYAAALAEALRLSFKHDKKVFIKEFLQAGFIARALSRMPRVRHVHAHFAHGTTTVAMFVSRITGLPFSFTAHAKDIYLRELNPGDLLHVKMRRAAFIATCTKANQHFLESIEKQGAPVHVVYHGLDTRMFRPESAAKGPADGPFTLLSVGRQVEKKGFTDLLEACSILRRAGWSFRCRIVGGADKYTAVIRKTIAGLSLEDVVSLEDSVTQEQLRNIYTECSVFVLPCRIVDNGDRDGIPNVLAEAMAMEMPVVSTSISGIPEILRHEQNGLLVEQKSPQQLAEAIGRLLADPELRLRLGRAARRTICDVFDSTKNMRQLESLFSRQLTMQATADATGNRPQEYVTPHATANR